MRLGPGLPTPGDRVPYTSIMRAIVVTQQTPSPAVELAEVDETILEGDVLIRVEFAGVNFKDSMVLEDGNRVARISPLIGGVDLAGEVLEAPDGTFPIGSKVIAHGHGVGTAAHGGFAELARVPLDWAVPLPSGLSTRAAMALGTAGFTSMASLLELERHGIEAGSAPLLVTGAAGGVGTTAVALAAASGHEVVGSSGRSEEEPFLRRLGCSEVIGRSDIDPTPERGLSAERWSGAIDCVGGAALPATLRTLRYGAAVAASGLTGGSQLTTSVFPFIVRGISLIGIDSVEMSSGRRQAVWTALAERFPLALLDEIVEREVSLEEVPGVLEEISRGAVRGRVVVDPQR